MEARSSAPGRLRKNGRWVRAYGDGTGILLYASVEGSGYQTLRALDQLTAAELRNGSPAS